VSKVLDFVHGPDNNESMERRQAFRFQLMPNGEQQRQMRRFALLCSLCLQQSTGAQERTVREERTLHSFPTGQTAGAVEAGSTVA
jgi:putative transposase